MKDFFISYTRPDRAWAEWIGSLLENEGYTVFLDVWDFRPGSNFVLQMQQGLTCKQTLMVLTEAYLKAVYTSAEWTALFSQDPTAQTRKLIPLRVQDFEPYGLIKPLVYIDLVGKDEAEAKQAILDGLKEDGRPKVPPNFPYRVHTS